MIIQIYAFTDIAQAVEAAEMGVDHIGFIAGDYGLVSGELSFTEARRLAQALPPHTVRVALTMAVQVDEILRMADAVRAGYRAHLHRPGRRRRGGDAGACAASCPPPCA